MTTHRSGFLHSPIGMTLNDPEYPIHLKVRLVDGTLDVRLLRVSDSTICIAVARGGGVGEGWAGGHCCPSIWAADALFLCGSWASCVVCEIANPAATSLKFVHLALRSKEASYGSQIV